MKLLLDENLSRRIVPFLQEVYPGSTQVALIGLERSVDREIRKYAAANGFVVVTRDSDFHELALVDGIPPPCVWLKTGNQSKQATLNALLSACEAIQRTLLQDGRACIEIY